jgi:hypothetical protein
MPTVILHVNNEEAVVGEVEALPAAGDTIILVKNPRRRGDKELPYLEPSVSQVIWPMHRLNYIEVLPSTEEEEIITFIRE